MGGFWTGGGGGGGAGDFIPEWVRQWAVDEGGTTNSPTIIKDLSTVTWTLTTNTLSAGDSFTVAAANKHRIRFRLTTDANAGARQVAASFSLGGSWQRVATTFDWAIDVSGSNAPADWWVIFWANTPPTNFGGASDNRIHLDTGSITKYVGGAGTAISLAYAHGVVTESHFSRAAAAISRTNNYIRAKRKQTGEKSAYPFYIHGQDVAYPTDAQLAQITHIGFGFQLGTGNTTADMIIFSPIIYAALP